MEINRNEFWKYYNISSNYAVDPLFGAIHILYLPNNVCIYNKSTEELIFSNYSDTNTPAFDGNGDTNNETYCLFYSHGEDPVNLAKKELNSRSLAWRKINLKDNLPVIVKKCEWKSEIEEDDVVLKKNYGFFLVYSKKVEKNKNFFYKCDCSSDEVIGLEKLETLDTNSSLIPGGEYLMVSDRNWNTWNYKANKILSSLEVIDEEYDFNKVFNKEIEEDLFLYDDFIFKPVDENILITPYGKEDESSTSDSFFHTINFTYSDKFPKIKVEDISPSFENHDITFKIGEPNEENGIKTIPISVYYNKDFTSNLITHNFGGDKNYKLFDDTGFIKLKVTCYNENGKDEETSSQECIVVLKSSNKTEPEKEIPITINNNKTFILKKNSGEVIDLYQLDENGSTIVGYNNSSPDSEDLSYKNDYKVKDENNNLYGYSWNKIFNENINIKFFKEEISFNKVSTLPIYINSGLFYSNNTNTSGFVYPLKGSFPPVEVKDYKKDNFYSTIKILSKNRLKKHEKLIRFGYNGDNLSNIIELVDINNNFSEELTSISPFRGCFFIPFYDAFVSEYDENIIKIICLATKNNKFIKEDESYYDLRKYEASIGSICSITIDLLFKTYNINEINSYEKVPSEEGVKTYKFYYPLVGNPEYIRSGEKLYKYKELSFDFLREVKLMEFNNRNNVDLWILPCKEITMKQKDADRSVLVESKFDKVLVLSSKIHEKKEFNTLDCTAIKDLKENTVYFSECGGQELNSFNADYLRFEVKKDYSQEDKHISHFFYFENEDEIDNSYSGLKKNILVVFKNGTISTLDEELKLESQESPKNEFKSFGSLNPNFNKIFNIHLSGIHKSGTIDDKKTDCTLISDNKIYRLHNGDSNKLKGIPEITEGKIVDVKVLNGILFALIKEPVVDSDENCSLSIYNFGNLHPSI